MSIVTMSHEMGAGGPEIGQQLAERLGYRYVDHELISDAAHRYGLLEEKLSHLDESKPSLFERFDAETRRYITALQTALYDFAEHRVTCAGDVHASSSRQIEYTFVPQTLGVKSPAAMAQAPSLAASLEADLDYRIERAIADGALLKVD